jgi:hypothetical protein
MANTLFIPEKLKVGFQNRTDTFTKRLAYVIYYDEKGKLRKETSWNTWCDKRIPSEEHVNVPKTGFILNKNIQRSRDWFGTGRTVFRVFHPEGFEFEITGDNLINILMHSDISKREILEPCILAWQGTNLILMTTNSEQYQESVEYTKQQTQKISAKDLVVGCEYLHRKTNIHYMYIGKFQAWSRHNIPDREVRGNYNYGFGRSGWTLSKYVWQYRQSKEPKHFFVRIRAVGGEHVTPTFNSIISLAPATLAARLTDTPSPDVAQYVDMFTKSTLLAPVARFEELVGVPGEIAVSALPWNDKVSFRTTCLLDNGGMAVIGVKGIIQGFGVDHNLHESDAIRLTLVNDSTAPPNIDVDSGYVALDLEQSELVMKTVQVEAGNFLTVITSRCVGEKDNALIDALNSMIIDGTAQQLDVRLRGYGERKMSRFVTTIGNLKNMLRTKFNGEWLVAPISAVGEPVLNGLPHSVSNSDYY